MLTRNRFRSALGFQPVYGPDDPPTPSLPAGGGTPTLPAGGGDGDPEMVKLNFSPEQQVYINRRMAEQRRAEQQKAEKAINDLKDLQNKVGTTEAQRAALQSQIDEFRKQTMSKEELAREESEKKRKDYESQVANEKKRGDTWEQRYRTSCIGRDLLDAASQADAFRAEQIVGMLEKHAQLVEEKDDAGNSTGRFVTRVQLPDFDKDGKAITLDLTAVEAVTKMKNTPERYGNLFKSTLASGLGQGGSANGGRRGGGKAASDMSTEEYIAAQKKDPSLGFVNE